MFSYEPSRMLASVRNRKLAEVRMVNIGGRPVIVPKANLVADKHNDSVKVALAFLAIYIVWGSTYLAIRYAVETIPPFLMGGTRFLVSGALLYAWARARGAPRPTKLQWRDATIAGVLMLC